MVRDEYPAPEGEEREEEMIREVVQPREDDDGNADEQMVCAEDDEYSNDLNECLVDDVYSTDVGE